MKVYILYYENTSDSTVCSRLVLGVFSTWEKAMVNGEFVHERLKLGFPWVEDIEIDSVDELYGIVNLFAGTIDKTQ